MAPAWMACRPGFFLPVRVLSRFFRRLFLERLQAAFDPGTLHSGGTLHARQDRCAWTRYLVPVRQAEWVVYAKRPFAGPQQVLDYVGRYTHRVAISNHRLLDIENGNVRFTYQDYRADPPQSLNTMTLAAGEFIRRFLLHVLPTGFHASAITGSLVPAIAERSWPAADNFSVPRRPLRPPAHRPQRPTIVTVCKRSPGSPYMPAPPVIVES